MDAREKACITLLGQVCGEAIYEKSENINGISKTVGLKRVPLGVLVIFSTVGLVRSLGRGAQSYGKAY